MRLIAIFILPLFLASSCSSRKTTTISYSVPEEVWETVIPNSTREEASPDRQPLKRNHLSLGNHRAVIKVHGDGEAAFLDLQWRRHDRNIERPRFYIINDETHDTVRNIHRLAVSNERCEIVFGPVKKGTYHFYYLPFELQGGWGGYGRNYVAREPLPDEAWMKDNDVEGRDRGSFIKTNCVEIQARTEFDSFWPMEVIATEEEKNNLFALAKGGGFMIFPEDRKYPIRMLDNIPQKWVTGQEKLNFSGEACRNEYYVFQLGLVALRDIEDVKVTFSSLAGKKDTLPVSSFTCFNTGGIDPYGRAFEKDIDVDAGKVQPLWIGIDIPADAAPGKYISEMTVLTANEGSKNVTVEIRITKKELADRGDSEAWRHSRLRWLNSTLGIDDNPVAPYKPVEVNGNSVKLTGREVVITGAGLPGSIKVQEREILAAPVEFGIWSAGRELEFKQSGDNSSRHTANGLYRRTKQETPGLILTIDSEVESDGWMKYTAVIEAVEKTAITDIRLTIPYTTESSEYLSGMKLFGVKTPSSHDAKWDPMHDAFWLGSTKAGLYCELRGASYSGPMLYYGPIREFYKPEPPVSWNNSGKGGFRITSGPSYRSASVYSGSRNLEKGEKIQFEWAFIITPVKDIDTKYEFSNRYFQNQYAPEPTEKEAAVGVKVVNLHHANEFNPTINYPFFAADKLKGYVDRCHALGIKTKIYYTTRELTNFTTEIWALRSLGTEILTGGRGGGYPWLREHYVDNYSTQWYQYMGGEMGADAAVLTSVGLTRFFNYYVEGIKWLVENVGIDGLYLDAASYDREMVRRIKKAMDSVKPACLLDLHEGHSAHLRYMEFFPYLDKTWIGESVKYNDINYTDWLISVSGIPFGFMSDMLQLGGNPWRGMIYGTSTRYGWTTDGVFCDPRNVWRVWDDFGIADSRMIGFWEDNPAVITTNPGVKATAYIKDGKTLVSIASWAPETVEVKLVIDYRQMGFDPQNIKITAPFVENFQPAREFGRDEPIPVEPTKGWLLIIEKK